MRNARILARMVASTLAAVVLVGGLSTAAQAKDSGWKSSDSGWKTSLVRDSGW
jgi:hypothetical protein